jgi:hypothetical protein
MKILVEALMLNLEFENSRLPSAPVKVVEIGLFESFTKQCERVTGIYFSSTLLSKFTLVFMNEKIEKMLQISRFQDLPLSCSGALATPLVE